jgi:hypothetical protein
MLAIRGIQIYRVYRHAPSSMSTNACFLDVMTAGAKVASVSSHSTRSCRETTVVVAVKVGITEGATGATLL